LQNEVKIGLPFHQAWEQMTDISPVSISRAKVPWGRIEIDAYSGGISRSYVHDGVQFSEL